MTAELQINRYHIFLEDQKQPALRYYRDDAGVLTLQLHRLRLSIYGRKFRRRWK